MTGKNEVKIGILMIVSFAIISAIAGDLGLIRFTSGMSILGWVAIFLYQFKVKGAKSFFSPQSPAKYYF